MRQRREQATDRFGLQLRRCGWEQVYEVCWLLRNNLMLVCAGNADSVWSFDVLQHRCQHFLGLHARGARAHSGCERACGRVRSACCCVLRELRECSCMTRECCRCCRVRCFEVLCAADDTETLAISPKELL